MLFQKFTRKIHIIFWCQKYILNFACFKILFFEVHWKIHKNDVFSGFWWFSVKIDSGWFPYVMSSEIHKFSKIMIFLCFLHFVFILFFINISCFFNLFLGVFLGLFLRVILKGFWSVSESVELYVEIQRDGVQVLRNSVWVCKNRCIFKV